MYGVYLFDVKKNEELKNLYDCQEGGEIDCNPVEEKVKKFDHYNE